MKKFSFFVGVFIIANLSFGQTVFRAQIAAKDADNVLRVLFVGDTSFGENYQERLEQKGQTNILKEKGYDYSMQGVTSLLESTDLTIANLETPLTELRSSPLSGQKSYLHWGDPKRVPEMLQKYGIKSVSLANNHTLDYGQRGLQDTIDALNSPKIAWFGAGSNAEEAAIPWQQKFIFDNKAFHLQAIGGYWYRESYAKSYNFYAQANRAGTNLWTESTAKEQIQKLRQENPCTYIVAFPHWGSNYDWKSKKQARLARIMVDAGADLVIGHGAHMAQEIEQYRGKWIFYSLGNFVFNSPGRYQKESAHPYSLAARLDIAQKNEILSLTLRAYPIFSDNRISNYQPRLVSKKEFNQLRSELFQHSNLPTQLTKQISLGKDDIGYYLNFNLSTLKALTVKESSPQNNGRKNYSTLNKTFCQTN